MPQGEDNARRNKTLLKGNMLAHPEVLLGQMNSLIEPSLGSPVRSALPVIERPTAKVILISFAAFHSGLLLAGAFGLHSSVVAILVVAELVVAPCPFRLARASPSGTTQRVTRCLAVAVTTS